MHPWIFGNPAAGGGSNSFPLDKTASTASIAVSHRALKAANANQPIYTLQRSSDSATQVFNSTVSVGNPPTAAINAFIGAGLGSIVTWNNQGSGPNFGQADVNPFPAWAVSAFSPLPSCVTSSAGNFLATVAPITIQAPYTVFTVCKILDANWGGYLFGGEDPVNFRNGSMLLKGQGPGAFADCAIESSIAGPEFEVLGDGSGFSSFYQQNILIDLTIDVANPNFGDFFVNGTPISCQGGGSTDVISFSAKFCIGDNDPLTNNTSNVEFAEFLAFPSIITTDRAAIRQAMADYWSITLA